MVGIQTCSSCHEPVASSAKFCPNCGTPQNLEPVVDLTDTSPPIFTDVASPAPERRHVTVVFCDLVGSTELSSSVDAEEFSDLIGAYHECAVGVAHRYGGQVDHYAGDGVNIVFGWPHAHEDDAERAVRCSLDIINEMRSPSVSTAAASVRLGVHSGVVVVGEMGASGQRSVMALGETMNVAARLQNEAATGTVVVSPTTLKMITGMFVTETIGVRNLKGIPTPMEVFRVVRRSNARSRFDGARAHLTTFVGRHAEQTTITELWHKTTEGQGQAILITGEAGIGKSRLAYQLRQQLLGTDHAWLECTASSYTQASVLRPAIELINDSLGIQRDDSPETRDTKIQAGIEAAGLIDDDAAIVSELLHSTNALGGGALRPERRGKRTIEVLARWVVSATTRRPTVVFVEDLHWCDDVTLALLQETVRRSYDVPLLVVMTARPEFTAWPTSIPVHIIELSPVSTEESLELVTSMVNGRDLPKGVIERILADTGGIPLYVEEILRNTLESGQLVAAGNSWTQSDETVGLELPSSLQASVMARLDRLGPAKSVAQYASVIGREFTVDLLTHVVDHSSPTLAHALDTLVHSDLIFQDLSRKQPTFIFKHALVQEAAYESLLRRTRKSVHGGIATALRDHQRTGIDVAHEVLARHYDQAGLVIDAMEFYTKAAYEAADRSGFKEAVVHFKRSIELSLELPESFDRDRREIELQLAMGSAVIDAQGYSDPATQTAYQRVRDLCERIGDEYGVAEATAGLSIYATNRGHIEHGAELAKRILEIAHRHQDDSLELLGQIATAQPLLYQGRVAESLQAARRALAVYNPERHRYIAQQFGTDHGVAAHMFAGWSLLLQGFVDQAWRHLDDSVALARTLDQPFNVAYALFFRCTVEWARGESAAALATAAEARELSQDQGFAFFAGVARIFELSELTVISRDTQHIPEILDTSIICSSTGNQGGSVPLMSRVAEALWAAGDIGTALFVLDGGFVSSQENGQPFWDVELYRMRAELTVAAALGGDDGMKSAAHQSALTDLGRAIDLAVATDNRYYELRARLALCRLTINSENYSQSLEALHIAINRCPEGHSTPTYLDAVAMVRS